MHERGYTAVGISEVCSHAGVNKGSFYHFFPSKQELALAVIDRFAERSEELTRETLEGDGPPIERLKAYFDHNYKFHKKMMKECGKVLGCPIGNLALEMSPQDPVLQQRLKKVFDRQAERYERLLAEAVGKGELPALDARSTAYAIIALHEGRIMLAKMNDDPELLRDLGDDVLRLIGAASLRT